MVPKMLNRMRVIAALAFFPGLIPSQSIRAQYLDHARIQHSNSWATVVANDSIPLFQAIYAVRLEYGWQINWESAPSYSHFDLVDVTDSEWRAAHPYEKGRRDRQEDCLPVPFQNQRKHQTRMPNALF